MRPVLLKLEKMEEFFYRLRVPKSYACRYIAKLQELGFDDVQSLTEDVRLSDLQSIGMKTGHFRRLARALTLKHERSSITSSDKLSDSIASWTNDDCLTWITDLFGQDKNLEKWTDAFVKHKITGKTLLACTSAADLEALGIPSGPEMKIFLDEVKELQPQFSTPSPTTETPKSSPSSDKFPVSYQFKSSFTDTSALASPDRKFRIPVPAVQSYTRGKDTQGMSAEGNMSIEGFGISREGIRIVPSLPITCGDNMVPRFTREATIIFGEIGRGGSGHVCEALYVPSLTLLAIKFVEVSDSARRAQMVKELKALYALSRFPLIHKGKSTSPTNEPLVEKHDNIGAVAAVAQKLPHSAVVSMRSALATVNATLFLGLFGVAGIGCVFITIIVANGNYAMQTALDKALAAAAVFMGVASAVCGLISVQQSGQAAIYKLEDQPALSNSDSIAPVGVNQPLAPLTPEMDEMVTDVGSVPGKSDYIIKFFDAYTDPEKGVVCIVLEYMDCGSLQNMIDQNIALDERDVAVIAYSVLSALHELHSRHIIHRDVKPGNMLINGKGQVKLSDFGIVRELTNEAMFAETFTGTLQYMSPERIKSDKYSYECDIWSLGISLVAVLTGKAPFPRARGYWGIVDALEKGLLPSLPTSDKNLYSVELSDFIGKCLTVNRFQRPNAATLLQHPFITAAKRQGVIPHDTTGNPPLLRNLVATAIDHAESEFLLDHILEWQLFHLVEYPVQDSTLITIPRFNAAKIEWLATQLYVNSKDLKCKFEDKQSRSEHIINYVLKQSKVVHAFVKKIIAERLPLGEQSTILSDPEFEWVSISDQEIIIKTLFDKFMLRQVNEGVAEQVLLRDEEFENNLILDVSWMAIQSSAKMPEKALVVDTNVKLGNKRHEHAVHSYSTREALTARPEYLISPDSTSRTMDIVNDLDSEGTLDNWTPLSEPRLVETPVLDEPSSVPLHAFQSPLPSGDPPTAKFLPKRQMPISTHKPELSSDWSPGAKACREPFTTIHANGVKTIPKRAYTLFGVEPPVLSKPLRRMGSSQSLTAYWDENCHVGTTSVLTQPRYQAAKTPGVTPDNSSPIRETGDDLPAGGIKHNMSEITDKAVNEADGTSQLNLGQEAITNDFGSLFIDTDDIDNNNDEQSGAAEDSDNCTSSGMLTDQPDDSEVVEQDNYDMLFKKSKSCKALTANALTDDTNYWTMQPLTTTSIASSHGSPCSGVYI